MREDNDNTKKNESGSKGIDSLDSALESLEKCDYIINYQKKYRIGDPMYEDNQFYFQFIIEFADGEKWILHHTTSIRDRILEQQWNSEHIKRLNSDVKKAYVVVPDGLKDKEQASALNYNSKIVNKQIYSALDGVVTLESIYSMIEKKASDMMEPGKARALLGLHFEEKLVDSLNNLDNLCKWKAASDTAVGYLYSLFFDVMNKFNIHPQTVISVSARRNIPQLPSGVMPKTDVIIEIETVESKRVFTVSCKRSISTRISVHEYSADAFADVLNPNDFELRHYLNEFQEAGDINSMKAESIICLTDRLKHYRKKLIRWVIGGVGGEGDPETQWADYVIVLNENIGKYSIKSLNEYVTEYERAEMIVQFGTPFQWTYPSGGKGKRIQLKGTIL